MRAYERLASAHSLRKHGGSSLAHTLDKMPSPVLARWRSSAHATISVGQATPKWRCPSFSQCLKAHFHTFVLTCAFSTHHSNGVSRRKMCSSARNRAGDPPTPQITTRAVNVPPHFDHGPCHALCARLAHKCRRVARIPRDFVRTCGICIAATAGQAASARVDDARRDRRENRGGRRIEACSLSSTSAV